MQSYKTKFCILTYKGIKVKTFHAFYAYIHSFPNGKIKIVRHLDIKKFSSNYICIQKKKSHAFIHAFKKKNFMHLYMHSKKKFSCIYTCIQKKFSCIFTCIQKKFSCIYTCIPKKKFSCIFTCIQKKILMHSKKKKKKFSCIYTCIQSKKKFPRIYTCIQSKKNSYAFIHAFKTKNQKMNFQIMVSWLSQDSSENVWRKNSKLYLQWRKDSKSYLHKNIWLNMLLQLDKELKVVSLLLKRWLKVNLLFGERTQSCISSEKRLKVISSQKSITQCHYS